MPHQADISIKRADWLARELQVHQIELETQNEELRRAQSDLAAARDRYMDLFDHAPVGYFTLDGDGVILECNLTGAELLGTQRAALTGAHLSRFMMRPDSDRWFLYLRNVLHSETPLRIEVALHRGKSSEPWFGQIDSVRTVAAGRLTTMRVTMTDITDRMQADAVRRIAAIDTEKREGERQRMALQLHEDLGQRLSAIKMDLAHLSPVGDGGVSRERIEAMLLSLDDSIATVRRITMELRPPMLDDLGLVAAVEWLVRDTARRLDLPCTLSLSAEPVELGEQVRLAAYRFVQEMVALLVQDAGGTHLHVGMRCMDGAFNLFLCARSREHTDPAEPAPDLQAVALLEQRARLLGGRLAIDVPRSQGGWIGLDLTLPVVTPDPSEQPRGKKP